MASSSDPFTWPTCAIISAVNGVTSNHAETARILFQNDIDGSVLLTLTDHELKNELGINSLGIRIRLRKFIEKLRGESDTYTQLVARRTQNDAGVRSTEAIRTMQQVGTAAVKTEGVESMSAQKRKPDEMSVDDSETSKRVKMERGGSVCQNLFAEALAFSSAPQSSLQRSEDAQEYAENQKFNNILAMELLQAKFQYEGVLEYPPPEPGHVKVEQGQSEAPPHPATKVKLEPELETTLAVQGTVDTEKMQVDELEHDERPQVKPMYNRSSLPPAGEVNPEPGLGRASPTQSIQRLVDIMDEDSDNEIVTWRPSTPPVGTTPKIIVISDDEESPVLVGEKKLGRMQKRRREAKRKQEDARVQKIEKARERREKEATEKREKGAREQRVKEAREQRVKERMEQRAKEVREWREKEAEKQSERQHQLTEHLEASRALRLGPSHLDGTAQASATQSVVRQSWETSTTTVFVGSYSPPVRRCIEQIEFAWEIKIADLIQVLGPTKLSPFFFQELAVFSKAIPSYAAAKVVLAKATLTKRHELFTTGDIADCLSKYYEDRPEWSRVYYTCLQLKTEVQHIWGGGLAQLLGTDLIPWVLTREFLIPLHLLAKRVPEFSEAKILLLNAREQRIQRTPPEPATRNCTLIDADVVAAWTKLDISSQRAPLQQDPRRSTKAHQQSGAENSSPKMYTGRDRYVIDDFVVIEDDNDADFLEDDDEYIDSNPAVSDGESDFSTDSDAERAAALARVERAKRRSKQREEREERLARRQDTVEIGPVGVQKPVLKSCLIKVKKYKRERVQAKDREQSMKYKKEIRALWQCNNLGVQLGDLFPHNGDVKCFEALRDFAKNVPGFHVALKLLRVARRNRLGDGPASHSREMELCEQDINVARVHLGLPNIELKPKIEMLQLRPRLENPNFKPRIEMLGIRPKFEPS